MLAYAFASASAYAADVVVVAVVVAATFVIVVAFADLYVAALVEFATYVDADVDAIVHDAIASYDFTVDAKPNVTDD